MKTVQQMLRPVLVKSIPYHYELVWPTELDRPYLKVFIQREEDGPYEVRWMRIELSEFLGE